MASITDIVSNIFYATVGSHLLAFFLNPQEGKMRNLDVSLPTSCTTCLLLMILHPSIIVRHPKIISHHHLPSFQHHTLLVDNGDLKTQQRKANATNLFT